MNRLVSLAVDLSAWAANLCVLQLRCPAWIHVAVIHATSNSLHVETLASKPVSLASPTLASPLTWLHVAALHVETLARKPVSRLAFDEGMCLGIPASVRGMKICEWCFYG